MSQIIQFLEAAGREPAPSPAGYAMAVAALTRNGRRCWSATTPHSNALLEGRPRMICMTNAPLADEEPGTDPDDRDGDGVPVEKQPSRQN